MHVVTSSIDNITAVCTFDYPTSNSCGVPLDSDFSSELQAVTKENDGMDSCMLQLLPEHTQLMKAPSEQLASSHHSVWVIPSSQLCTLSMLASLSRWMFAGLCCTHVFQHLLLWPANTFSTLDSDSAAAVKNPMVKPDCASISLCSIRTQSLLVFIGSTNS